MTGCYFVPEKFNIHSLHGPLFYITEFCVVSVTLVLKVIFLTDPLLSVMFITRKLYWWFTAGLFFFLT